MSSEALGRWVNVEVNRSPSANTPTLYYTATDPLTFGMNVCNGEGSDAHISIWIIPGAESWESGTPPPYTVVHKNQRIESDGTDGNSWVMPNVILNAGDKVVVMTTIAGVTFLGHGFKMVSV